MFVEQHAATARVIAANLRRTGLDGRARVVARDAIAWLGDAAGAAAAGPFDLVLVDPPYEDTAALAPGARARRRRTSPGTARSSPSTSGATPRPREIGLLASRRERRFGETALTFYRRRPTATASPRGGRRGVKVAVYPGSFDPITNGHLDVIERAARVFDRVVVAVLGNPRKSPLLAADDARRDHPRGARRRTRSSPGGSRSATFDGLTVDFCRAVGAGFLVRGLRAIADFETELQLAHNNHQLAPEVDTVFFMTSLEHSYVSSSLVKEIALFGGDVSAMVPPPRPPRWVARCRRAG